MMNIVYRLLTKDDIDQYRRVRLECLLNFPDNFGSTFEEESQLSRLKLEESILHADPDSFMYGSFQEMNLIGICGFVNETRQKTKHRGEIVQMYIVPAFSGYGIGENLLRYCIEKAFANGIEQIILSAVADNLRAIYAYTKVGFKRYGYLENYFKSGNQYSAQEFMVLNKPDYKK